MRTRAFISSLLVCFLISLTQLQAQRTPFVTKLHGDFRGLQKLANQAQPKLYSPLYVGGFLPGVGNVSLQFTSARGRSWQAFREVQGLEIADDSTLVLLRGRVKLANGSVEPVSAALFAVDNELKLHLRLRASRRSNQGAFYYLQASVLPKRFEISNSRQARVRRMPQSFVTKVVYDRIHHPDPTTLKKALANHPAQSQPTASNYIASPPLASNASNTRILHLATLADPAYSNIYGVSANNQIAALVEATNVIFQRDINLRLQIVKQVARNPAQQGDVSADSLLDSFVVTNINSKELMPADVFHLFSGRNFNGSVIGLAYIGTTCLNDFVGGNSLSYSISQDFHPSINALILAHEIGHNMGADHDSTTQPPSLMFPSADPQLNYISDFSANEIAQHFAQSGISCLGGFGDALPPNSTPTPTPTPAPPGGGGGGGATFPPSGASAFSTGRLTTAGRFNFRTELDSAIPESCTISVQSSRSRNFDRQFSSIYESLVQGRVVSLTANIRRSALKDKTGKSFIFLRAQYFCAPMTLIRTNTVRIDAARVKSPKKGLGVAKWVTLLGRSTVAE